MLVTTFASNKCPPPYTTGVCASPENHTENLQIHRRLIDRRDILASLAASITPFFSPHPRLNNEGSTLLPISILPSADARGLFQMPPVRLSNRKIHIRFLHWRKVVCPSSLLITSDFYRYFLVRAGESEFESSGIINTNPVAKTSVDNGLSETGKKQTVRAALTLKEMGACENSCWIWPSITQRAYQAAEIIAAVNGVNRR